MPIIECTKEYHVYHKMGSFRIYVSRHSDGLCYGTVVYYYKSGKTPEQKGQCFDIEAHFILGTNKASVFQECKDWISGNLGSDFVMGEAIERIKPLQGETHLPTI